MPARSVTAPERCVAPAHIGAQILTPERQSERVVGDAHQTLFRQIQIFQKLANNGWLSRYHYGGLLVCPMLLEYM